MVRPVIPLRPLANAVLACGIAISSASAPAQSTSSAELERRLDESNRVIESLGARVRDLEGRVGSQPAAKPDTRVRPDHDHAHSGPAVDGGSQLTIPPIPLRGFADVGTGYVSGGGKRGFTVGSLDFYLAPNFENNARALMEIVFEVDEHGELHTDLERLQLGYAFSNALTAWVGRFHAPFGYWNTAFHHGQQLQPSILRPRFIDFEDRGGIMPAHVVGLWTNGVMRLGGGRITYDVFAGNNPGIKQGVLTPNIAGTNHGGLATGFNLGYRFAGVLRGLTTGVHGLHFTARDDTVPANVMRVGMLGGYGAYEGERFEAITEYYQFNNKNVSGGAGRHASWAGFFQVGFRLGPWVPFARLERTVLDRNDRYFSLQTTGRSYSRQATGVRFDLSSSAALKFEVNRTRTWDGAPTGYNEMRFQYAIRF
jgi:hypothetical protein